MFGCFRSTRIPFFALNVFALCARVCVDVHIQGPINKLHSLKRLLSAENIKNSSRIHQPKLFSLDKQSLSQKHRTFQCQLLWHFYFVFVRRTYKIDFTHFAIFGKISSSFTCLFLWVCVILSPAFAPLFLSRFSVAAIHLIFFLGTTNKQIQRLFLPYSTIVGFFTFIKWTTYDKTEIVQLIHRTRFNLYLVCRKQSIVFWLILCIMSLNKSAQSHCNSSFFSLP